jgi:hypothetical protein
VAQVIEHHRPGPDLPNRVGDAPAGDVRGRAVHGFEHRREIAFRVDVGARRNAYGAGRRRPQVRQNVAEQVRADHDVEPVRVQDEVGAQDVDVVPVGRDLGIVYGHGGEALVPVGHGVDDAVRLGRRGQVSLRPTLRQLESVAKRAVDALPREDVFLDHRLLLGSGVEHSADLGVLALVVLAHDEEIDVPGLAAGERRADAFEEPHRPEVDVLPETAADRNQKAP